MGVFITIVAAIFDYGWYFFLRSSAISAAREGCRSGAVLPQDNSPTPDARATTVMTNLLANYGQKCGGDDCDVAATYVDTSPTEQLQCTVTVNYDSLTGLSPMPGEIVIVSTSLLEDQD